MLTIDEKKNNKTFVHPTKHDTIYYTTPQRSLAPPRLGTSSAKCLLGSVTTEKKTTTFKRAFIWAECITPEYQTSVSEGKGKEKSGKKGENLLFLSALWRPDPGAIVDIKGRKNL